MVAISVPTGLRGDSETPKQRETLLNCYYEPGDVGTLSPRPGVAEYLSAYGSTRGHGKFQDKAYYVQADRLIEVSEDGNGIPSFTIIGGVGDTIAGSADCLLIQSFTRLLIMVKGGNAYVYDGTTLEQITDPQYETSIDAAFLLSRFVFVPADGGPYFWSELNDPSNIQPENFADAEVLPDKNAGVAELKDTLLIFGEDTIERHQFNAGADTFQRIQGATQNIGFIGGKARYGETLAYIGRTRNGQPSIFVYPGTDPVSNKAVDEILNTYSVDELRDVRADSFSWKGQNKVVWYLPNHTLYFYGDFSLVKTGVDGQLTGNWTAEFIQDFNGRLLCGDRSSNRIGQLVNTFTDYGEKIEAEVVTYIRAEPRTHLFVRKVYFTCTTGLDDNDSEYSSVGMSFNKDGKDFGPLIYRQFGQKGVFNHEISSSGVIGRTDNFLGVKFRWADSMRVPIDGIYYD